MRYIPTFESFINEDTPNQETIEPIDTKWDKMEPEERVGLLSTVSDDMDEVEKWAGMSWNSLPEEIVSQLSRTDESTKTEDADRKLDQIELEFLEKLYSRTKTEKLKKQIEKLKEKLHESEEGTYRNTNDFDTKLEKDVDKIEPGDEVFHMGKWQTVSEIRQDTVAVFDDKEKASVIRKADITSRGVLVKISPIQGTNFSDKKEAQDAADGIRDFANKNRK